ncbi:carboxymuconolactone decarboxylase family protein [Mycobacteroides stephanolepidis]|nr:carboxymuconolactone decarboxylase family protein [[Mycobacterium] stephanolepidis]
MQERIMLAVTSVNKCRFCTWRHTELAGAEGIPQEAIADLLRVGADSAYVSENEYPSLAYAVHWAETGGHPRVDLREELYSFYGKEVAIEIEVIIRRIMFGNLTGNTFDALNSRLHGQPVQGSSLISELIVGSATPLFLLANRRANKHG